MIELIQSVIRTLDSIEVRGTANMQKLLGCISALKTIIEEESKKEDAQDG